MNTEAIWLELPIPVKCVRGRCRSVESYVVLRNRVVAVEAYQGDEAPVCLEVVRLKNAHYSGLLYGNTTEVRRAGSGWCSRLTAPDRGPAASLDTATFLKEIREGRQWPDYPYALDLRWASTKNIEVHKEEGFTISNLQSAYDLDTDNEVANAAKTFCLVDGQIHRRRSPPYVAVRVCHAAYKGEGPPTSVLVEASLADEPPPDDNSLSFQRFAPHRHEAAIRFANRVAETMMCPPKLSSYYRTTDSYEADDDDFAQLAYDAARRFFSYAPRWIGHLPRSSVLPYLDLRDQASDPRRDDTAFMDAFVSLFMDVRSQNSRAAKSLSARMQYDVMRLEVERPDFKVFAVAQENPGTLALIDDESFLFALG